MEPRLSLVTLGVADVARSRAFYERLGFRVVSEEFLEAGIPHVDMVRHSN